MSIFNELINNGKIHRIITNKFGKDCGDIIYNYKIRMETLEKIDECFNKKNRDIVYHLNISFENFKQYCLEHNYNIVIEFVIQVNSSITYCIMDLENIEYISETVNIRYICDMNNNGVLKIEFYLGYFKIKYSKLELFRKIPGNIFNTYLLHPSNIN